MACGPVCLASVPWHRVFKVHLCRRYQYFTAFLVLNAIHIYLYLYLYIEIHTDSYVLFVHSSVDGHFGGFLPW